MAKWLIHRFPKLAKLSPILRTIEILDMAISFYERLPKVVKWAGRFAMTGLIARWVQIQAVVWSWVEPNWRGFVFIFVPLLFLLALYYCILRWRNRALSPMKSTANNQDVLNMIIRGRIGGNQRIIDTPEGNNPFLRLQNPLYAGGVLWDISLLFVNKEEHPVNITVSLAIPIRKDDKSKRFRILPLSKPIYNYREDMKPHLYFLPEHLAFPVYIDSGKAVNGHVEFAIEGFQYNALGDSFTQIVGGHDHILEVEDLLSGKRAEFNL